MDYKEMILAASGVYKKSDLLFLNAEGTERHLKKTYDYFVDKVSYLILDGSSYEDKVTGKSRDRAKEYLDMTIPAEIKGGYVEMDDDEKYIGSFYKKELKAFIKWEKAKNNLVFYINFPDREAEELYDQMAIGLCLYIESTVTAD